MNSPPWSLVYPVIMTKTNAKRNKQKPKQATRAAAAPTKARAKSTPFRDTGGILGKAVGGIFGNAKIGGNVGKWLGTGIGSIFGSGDYHLAGAMPKYNLFANGGQIPKFSTNHQTNIVCHREYLGDITGTAAFANQLFPLNPGISKTFPWLSTIASGYQEYKFHGLVFEFRSGVTDFVTNGTPGYVVMATNYNADVPIYSTKQQMENSEYAVSVKPTDNLMHMVECDPIQTVVPQAYVRTGGVPAGQDLRLYDQGNFQFATISNPVQNIGELWVTYCVEFFKPILPLTSAAAGGAVDHYTRGNGSGGNTTLFGLIPISNNLQQLGTNVVQTSSTVSTLFFPTFFAGVYCVEVTWVGTAVAISTPVITYGSCSNVPVFNGGVAQLNAPNAGVTATTYTLTLYVAVPAQSGGASVTFTGGLYPSNGGQEIFITQVTDLMA